MAYENNVSYLHMKEFSYHLIFKPEPEGGFTVTVPVLPGCTSYGKTLSQAKAMIQDAIKGYIASLKKHRELIPSDDESFISVVKIGYLNKKSNINE